MTRTKKIVLIAVAVVALAGLATGGVFGVKKHKANKALPVKEAK